MVPINYGSNIYINLYHEQRVLNDPSTGQPIAQGAQVVLGEGLVMVGDLGNSTQCHLHFDVNIGWSGIGWSGSNYDVDPTSYLAASPAPLYAAAASRVRGNFLGNGYDATAVLYDDGGGHARIFVWPNTTTSHLGGLEVWWNSTDAMATFDASKAKIVAGDFNGDGVTDLAILYDASDTTCTNRAIWYFLKSDAPTRHYFDTSSWWDSRNALNHSQTDCGFTVSRTKLVVGNFDGGDATDEVAVFYDESTGSCADSIVWWVFLSTSTSFQIDTLSGDPSLTHWWYNSNPYGNTCGAFSWSKSKPMAGYFGSFSVAEVAVYYDYSATCAPTTQHQRSVLDVFTSNGASFGGFFPWWDSNSNCNRFPWSQSLPLAGNFTGHGNGLTDVAILFDSSSACQPAQPRTQLYLLVSDGSSLQVSTQPAPWDSQCGTFTWNWSKAEVGNFSGGTVADVAVLYYYTWHCPAQQADSGWLVFVPSGAGFPNGYGSGRWDPGSPTACNGVDWNRSTPT
jgi:hypothetical protein